MSSTDARTKKQRPALPFAYANPLIQNVEKDPVVKYQVIEREGQEIIIGRVKVPTPNGGHAFILRRFDTGAVSLTTMFRAAFPEATEELEKMDANWIKAAYDCVGANGGSKGIGRQYLRLAGTWLPADVALSVAESYAISKIVKPLAEAVPDTTQQYRKSGTSQTQSNGAQEDLDTKPPSSASVSESLTSPPAKRRKASPAAAAPLSPPATITTRARTRASKSPAPVTKPPSKPRSKKGSIALAPPAATPPASDDLDYDIPPFIEPEDPDIDIAESKKLVEEVKASYGKPSSKRTLKRPVEDETLIFEPKEPEIGERAIIAGPRRLRNLAPQRQAVAWGALAFAVGLGATAFLPQIFF